MPKRLPISPQLRQRVSQRAGQLCEYCLIHEDDTFFGCQIDHIISIKHGGKNKVSNLAYACTVCNRAKGSDVGSVILQTGQFIRFFNPRIDIWLEHFDFDGVMIKPQTDIGQVTCRILRFNTPERLVERELLHTTGRYPPPDRKAHT